jgi:hypothetical protein
MIKADQLKQHFTIPLKLDFTNADLTDVIDLGCIYLSPLRKELGYGISLEGHIIIDKKTSLPIPLNGKWIEFDKITGSNKDIPQEKYFILRFSENNRVNMYTPEGKPVELEGYEPVEADVYCGKNVVVFSPAWSGKYIFFDPVTGKKIDVEAMLSEHFGDISDAEVSTKASEINGDVVITLSGRSQKFRISEGSMLEEIK